MEKLEETNWLERVYRSKTSGQVARIYDEWSSVYEEEVFKYGYTTTAVVTGLAGRYIPPGPTPICEAGVGTGLLGEGLKILGYTHIDGFDISPGMLKVAEKKGAYRSLREMALGDPLDIPTGTYKSVLSMGTFTVGHAPAEGFDELVRITEPGGIIILSIRIDREDLTGFLTRLKLLEDQGRWTCIDRSEVFQSVPLGEPEVQNQAFVYKVRGK